MRRRLSTGHCNRVQMELKVQSTPAKSCSRDRIHRELQKQSSRRKSWRDEMTALVACWSHCRTSAATLDAERLLPQAWEVMTSLGSRAAGDDRTRYWARSWADFSTVNSHSLTETMPQSVKSWTLHRELLQFWKNWRIAASIKLRNPRRSQKPKNVENPTTWLPADGPQRVLDVCDHGTLPTGILCGEKQAHHSACFPEGRQNRSKITEGPVRTSFSYVKESWHFFTFYK
jgi:hypothetical protein